MFETSSSSYCWNRKVARKGCQGRVPSLTYPIFPSGTGYSGTAGVCVVRPSDIPGYVGYIGCGPCKQGRCLSIRPETQRRSLAYKVSNSCGPKNRPHLLPRRAGPPASDALFSPSSFLSRHPCVRFFLGSHLNLTRNSRKEKLRHTATRTHD